MWRSKPIVGFPGTRTCSCSVTPPPFRARTDALCLRLARSHSNKVPKRQKTWCVCCAAKRPFEYLDFGQLVSVGHQFAAVRLLGVRLSGFIAWFVWRSLYLGKLVGFGNKIRVMLDWTLDLFVERSSSQIHATREKLEADAVHHDHDYELALEADAPVAFSRAREMAAPVTGS